MSENFNSSNTSQLWFILNIKNIKKYLLKMKILLENSLKIIEKNNHLIIIVL